MTTRAAALLSLTLSHLSHYLAVIYHLPTHLEHGGVGVLVLVPSQRHLPHDAAAADADAASAASYVHHEGHHGVVDGHAAQRAQTTHAVVAAAEPAQVRGCVRMACRQQHDDSSSNNSSSSSRLGVE